VGVGVCVCVSLSLLFVVQVRKRVCLLSLFLLLQYLSARAFLPFFLAKQKKKNSHNLFFVPAHFQPFEKEKRILTVRTKPCTKEARKTKLR
jgi:hypothetical protein